MPQGYLSMLYLAIFLPGIFKKIMVNKLQDWDENYATDEEKKLSAIQNENSNMPLLLNR